MIIGTGFKIFIFLKPCIIKLFWGFKVKWTYCVANVALLPLNWCVEEEQFFFDKSFYVFYKYV